MESGPHRMKGLTSGKVSGSVGETEGRHMAVYSQAGQGTSFVSLCFRCSTVFAVRYGMAM